jgi:hypothetical protein
MVRAFKNGVHDLPLAHQWMSDDTCTHKQHFPWQRFASSVQTDGAARDCHALIHSLRV